MVSLWRHIPHRSRGNLKAAGNCCNGRKVWSNRSTALHSVYDTAWRSIPAEDGNPEHMKTNAEVDFEIRKEDMEVLKNFKHIGNYGESSGFPVYGGKM